jgi:hypothetical protein
VHLVGSVIRKFCVLCVLSLAVDVVHAHVLFEFDLSGPKDGNHPITFALIMILIDYLFLYDCSLFEKHFPQELSSNYGRLNNKQMYDNKH